MNNMKQTLIMKECFELLKKKIIVTQVDDRNKYTAVLT